MNKKWLTISSLVFSFCLFLVFFASSLIAFNSVKSSSIEENNQHTEVIVNQLNTGTSPTDIIDTYQDIPDIYVSFYNNSNEDPLLLSYLTIVASQPLSYLMNNLNKTLILSDTSLGFKVTSSFTWIAKDFLYVRVEKKLPSSYYVNRNVVIFNSIISIALGLGYMVLLIHSYQQSLKPLRIQVKKLHEIVRPGKPIQEGNDINNMSMMIRDSRKDLQQQLEVNRMGEQKIHFILDSIAQGLIVVDASYKIVMINKQASTIFKTGADDLVGQNMEILNMARHLEKTISLVIQTKRSIVYEEEMSGKVYQCNINPIDYSWTRVNEQNGASILMIDITEQYYSAKMKKEFFDNASHELKSPLTSILGYLQMIDEGIYSSPQDVDNAIEKSIKECHRMNKIIVDMLTLSSLEKEELRPVEEISVSDTVRAIIPSYEVQLKSKNITINSNKAILIIKINYEDFYRLVSNLIDNAIKYNKPDGTITINIDSTERSLAVSDTGIGISQADTNRIFERFYRVDKARSRANGGTGLGLAIVKHICNYYDYKIVVDSKLGVGTTFKVLFGQEEKKY
jgi:two-component system phosphate regulon sensor histidine kinase PhoR